MCKHLTHQSICHTFTKPAVLMVWPISFYPSWSILTYVTTPTLLTKSWSKLVMRLVEIGRGGTIQFLDSCHPGEGGVQSATQTVTQTRIWLAIHLGSCLYGGMNCPPSSDWRWILICMADMNPKTGLYYTWKLVKECSVPAQFLPGILFANLCKNKQKQTNREGWTKLSITSVEYRLGLGLGWF